MTDYQDPSQPFSMQALMAQPQQPDNGGMPAAVSNIGQYLGGVVERDKQAKAESEITMKYDSKTDKATFEGPPDIIHSYKQKADKYDQIQGIYDQMIQQNLARQQQMQKHPFANALAQIGASVASHDQNPLVRQIGAAAQDMNPTPGQLQRTQMGLLQGSLGVQEAKGQLDTQYLAQQRETRLADMAQRKEGEVTFKDLSSQAQKGELNDTALVQKVLEGANIPKEQAAAQAQELVKASAAKQAAVAAAEGAKDNRQAAMFRAESERLQKQMDTTLKVAEVHMNATLRAAEIRADASDKKAQKTKDEIPKTLPDKLQALDAAEKSLDRVEQVIKEQGGKMGAIAGRTIAPIAGYLDKDVARAETNLKLEVSQAIKATGAGARGFGPMERGFFEKLATGFHKSPDENLGVVAAWRDYLRQQRSGYADAYPGLAKDPKWKKVFGKDADTLGVDEDPLGILKK